MIESALDNGPRRLQFCFVFGSRWTVSALAFAAYRRVRSDAGQRGASGSYRPLLSRYDGLTSSAVFSRISPLIVSM